jgi:hypothetical protein
MEGFIALQAATVALFVLEGLKWIVRKLKKDDGFSFAPIFYTLLIPFLTALAGIGMGMLGWTPAVVFEWQTLVQWGVAILIELALYSMGVQPFKEYRAASK